MQVENWTVVSIQESDRVAWEAGQVLVVEMPERTTHALIRFTNGRSGPLLPEQVLAAANPVNGERIPSRSPETGRPPV